MFPAILAALGKAATLVAPKASAAVGGGLGGLLGAAAPAAAAPTAASGLLSVPLNSTAGLGQLSSGLGQAISGGGYASGLQQAAAAPQSMASKIGSSFLKGSAPDMQTAQADIIQSQPVMRGKYQRMFPTPRV